jgi:hypothetical protein
MARTLAATEIFRAVAKDTHRTLDTIAMSGTGELIAPHIPDDNRYHAIFRQLADNTGLPEMEVAFYAQFHDFSAERADLLLRLRDLGIVFPGVVMPDSAEALGHFYVPMFDESGLPDSEEVRKAYDIVVRNPNASSESQALAFSVGRLLAGEDGMGSPTAVAAAMLDAMAAGGLEKEDIAILKTLFNWDVIELLSHGSPRFAGNDQSAFYMPAEYRQIILAHGIDSLASSKRLLEDLVAEAEEKNIPAENVAEGMSMVRLQNRFTQMAISPLIGTTDRDDLDRKFIDALEDIDNYVATHMPDMPQRRRPAPPKPEDFGPF